MTITEATAVSNLLLIRNFFDAQTCGMILAEMRSARSGPATVYRDVASGAVDDRVRKATRILPSPETTEFIKQRLLERKQVVEDYFQVSLSECEDPQFLRYGVGDFFVAHQDGNTGLLRFDRERIRSVSVVIFLSNQSDAPESGDYCGGSLILYELGDYANRADSSVHVCGERGTLAAFRPETTHEVTPVTHGERYSIVCWYR
ncbi:MAG: 2OG-Fe(II) oxygenase [Acidobacteriota bacterium]